MFINLKSFISWSKEMMNGLRQCALSGIKLHSQLANESREVTFFIVVDVSNLYVEQRAEQTMSRRHAPAKHNSNQKCKEGCRTFHISCS
jgi:hypothetical protein